MSYQAETWVKHTLKYLGASDEALASLFLQAMERAGYPELSAADAIEAICADFLAGPSLRSEGGGINHDRCTGRPDCPCPRFVHLCGCALAGSGHLESCPIYGQPEKEKA